jgi:hypothetical protein
MVYFYFLCVTGSLATLILPAAIYLKVMPQESEMYNHARVLFVFGILVMLAVVTFTIIDVAK